jgi:hypothetical protein
MSMRLPFAGLLMVIVATSSATDTIKWFMVKIPLVLSVCQIRMGRLNQRQEFSISFQDDPACRIGA